MALIHVQNAEEFKARYVQVMADWDKWRSSNFFFFKIADPDVLLHVEVFPKTKETHASFVSYKYGDAVQGLILHDAEIETAESVPPITAADDAASIIGFLGRWLEQLEIFGGEEGLKAEKARRREIMKQKMEEARRGK